MFAKRKDLAVELKQSKRSCRYQSQLVWNGERHGVASVAGKPNVLFSSPAEFKGDPDRWSPEDMFVTAVNACLLMTFLAYSQREELELARYQSSAEGLLEFSNGKYRFTEVIVRPRLTLKTEEDAEIARMVLESAHRDCIITNSVAAFVRIEPKIGVETGL